MVLPACADGTPCQTPIPEPEPSCIELPFEAFEEYEGLFQHARLDLACLPLNGRIERVADPASEPIDVVIGATLGQEPDEQRMSPTSGVGPSAP